MGPTIAITLTNLGNIQQQLGHLEGARALLQRAHGIFMIALDPTIPTPGRQSEFLRITDN